MVAYKVLVDATVTHAGSPLEGFSALRRIAPVAASSPCTECCDLNFNTSAVSATDTVFLDFPINKSNEKLLLHKYMQVDQ